MKGPVRRLLQQWREVVVQGVSRRGRGAAGAQACCPRAKWHGHLGKLAVPNTVKHSPTL